jgi:hypothetical protein
LPDNTIRAAEVPSQLKTKSKMSCAGRTRSAAAGCPYPARSIAIETTMTVRATGRIRRDRRAKNSDGEIPPSEVDRRISMDVMTNPEITKNTSTPSPLLLPGMAKWFTSTRPMATARRPSMSVR